VTLSIKEGSRVVLIGKQSEGVQAIKKLMCREGNWQNKEGRVLIDKKDITRLTHKGILIITQIFLIR
jgi:ABC-type phosphate/phosphonate transport system ATPase subunit